MPTVSLRFSPLAEHVRTARLVAVSVARRAGFDDDQLDEIRIAIGEACARAVAGGALQTTTGPAVGLVDMQLCDDEDRLDVSVVQCDADGRPLTSGPGTLQTADPLSLALMAGLADSSRESNTSGGVSLTWNRHTPSGAPARAF